MKLYNGQIFSMDAPTIATGWVEVRDGKIVALGEGTCSTAPGDIDLKGGMLLPALLTRTRISASLGTAWDLSRTTATR